MKVEWTRFMANLPVELVGLGMVFYTIVLTFEKKITMEQMERPNIDHCLN